MTVKKVDVSEFDEQEFLEMMAGSSLKDKMKRTRQQAEKPDENELSESSSSIGITSQNMDSDEIVSDNRAKKTMTSKQRKASLIEYRETFLRVPKIMDRKTVFISNDLRERVIEVILRLGTEKSSVSGFVENLLKAHLADYADDINAWKKL
jgi:hypothetical protein